LNGEDRFAADFGVEQPADGQSVVVDEFRLKTIARAAGEQTVCRVSLKQVLAHA